MDPIPTVVKVCNTFRWKTDAKGEQKRVPVKRIYKVKAPVLSDDQRDQLFRLYRDGIPKKRLAENFGVSGYIVSKVITEKLTQ